MTLPEPLPPPTITCLKNQVKKEGCEDPAAGSAVQIHVLPPGREGVTSASERVDF